ncbi:MAG: replication restart helicase PriA, partial [Ktedonobacterales bacterium]
LSRAKTRRHRHHPGVSAVAAADARAGACDDRKCDDATASTPDTSNAPAEPAQPLRPIAGILLDEPLLHPTQRALAEWLADHYAAPLAATARLMLPPGLLRGLRTVLRLRESPPDTDSTTDTSADAPPDHLTLAATLDDDGVVLGMLRTRGSLDRRQIESVLGRSRALASIRRLIAQRRVVLAVELSEATLTSRRERRVHVVASPASLDTWRSQARATLDILPALPTTGKRRPAWRRLEKGERQAERLLRQLAVLDVLAHPSDMPNETSVLPISPAPNTPEESSSAPASHPVPPHSPFPPKDGGRRLGSSWRLEELMRLTRVTQAALAELAHAGLIAIDEHEARRDPFAGRTIARSVPLPLTPAQSAALTTILPTGDSADTPSASTSSRRRVFLLHGITGSGKTEVYLQALAATIARGQRGIVLVPEIALTPQAMERYAGRFPGRVALLHSGLSDGERLDEWRRIRAGKVDVVLGSRSALFAPVDRLGLIIVDEEHEAAYKQDRTPTYHARDAAVRLGELSGATVVLGSATPSVESYWLATQGTYTLVELRERAPTAASDVRSEDQTKGSGAAAERSAGLGEVAASPPGLPPVTVIDLRAELRAGNTSILSEALRIALHQTIERGEQAILFLNRRGTASSVVCRECGYVARCHRCDVSMTYHAAEQAILLCHYCGRREPAPQTCPICWSASIRYFGLGTERVESAVKRQFPAARVLRWDRDTARSRQAHEDLLRAFSERRADVLVGTQMIAKGLDLPGVTLVGVVSADVALFLPDFRASERAFQLLTQVAGRAGRGQTPGRVLVQTLNPDHFCIQAAARHDYHEFFAAEVSARSRYGYPPFRRFVKWTYEHTDRYTAQVEAMVLCDRIEQHIARLRLPETDVVGPAPAFLERLRGRYRWQVIVRSPDPRPILRALAAEDGALSGWSLDVDPASIL